MVHMEVTQWTPLLTTVAGIYLLHSNFYYVPGKGDVFLVLVFRYFFFLGQDDQLVKNTEFL